MKNQYWHFGYVFVIGVFLALIFYGQNYKQRTEVTLVDATQTLELSEKVLRYNARHAYYQIEDAIQRSLDSTLKVQGKAVLANQTSISSFVYKLDEKSAKYAINWHEIHNDYQILTTNLQKYILNEHPATKENLQKTFIHEDKIANLSNLSPLYQQYWLQNYKINISKTWLFILHYMIERTSLGCYANAHAQNVIDIQFKQDTIRAGEYCEIDINIVRRECFTKENKRKWLIVNGSSVDFPQNQFFYHYKQCIPQGRIGQFVFSVYIGIENQFTGERHGFREEKTLTVIP
jgi:hypothetical protein